MHKTSTMFYKYTVCVNSFEFGSNYAFLSFNSKVQMAAKWSLAKRELPGHPTVIATLQYTGIAEQCPPPSWVFKQLSISYESTEVSMLSAMSHLSLSNLMK